MTGVNIKDTVMVQSHQVKDHENNTDSLPIKSGRVRDAESCVPWENLKPPISELLLVTCLPKATTTPADAEAQFSLPTTPAGHYMIAEDQTIVSGSVLNVVDALMLMFAAYYCLNISYCSELGATLEFLQRCLFKISPDKGTKVERKE
ncbi:hypothetical protein NQZ68_019173 [Dissostichus eleginoides]|nr:hypothetical protein NQZ68_019173 [Dissostichus eleginoides]